MKKEINHILWVMAVIWLGIANSIAAMADDAPKYVKTIESSYQPAGKPFMLSSDGTEAGKELAINWETQAIRAIINLEGCTGTNENILSIGNSIHQWRESTPYYNLHFYYTKSTRMLIMDLVDSSDGFVNNLAGKFEVLSSPEDGKLYIELNKDGLYLNGNKIETLNANKMKDILALSTIQVGSTQGDNRSNATYDKLAIEKTESTVLTPPTTELKTTAKWTNYYPYGKKFYSTQDIDFTQQALKVSMDLSQCSDQDVYENILSIGNNLDAISNWGGDGWYTLHLYYKKKTNELQVNYQNASKSDASKSTIYLSSTDLSLELSARGLYINGKLFKDKDDSSKKFDATMLANLLKCTNLSFGSMQGDNRSHVTYKSLSIEKPTPIDEKLTDFPWIDKAGEGTRFYSEINDIDFTKQSIDATIDLSTCDTQQDKNGKTFETILSIGSDIANWDGTDQYNLHIYYSKVDKKLEADFLNSSIHNADQTTYTIENLEPGAIKVHLGNNGLLINGKEAGKITAAKLAKLLALTSVQIGNLQGELPSHATYKNVTVNYSLFNVSWIQDETKFEDKKEEPHATYIPYATTGDMKNDVGFYNTPWTESQSSLVKNLNTVNGDEWKFCYVKGTTSGPGASDFFAKDFENSSDYVESDWKTIRVPLSWEMAGYGRPVYTNIGYPFKYKPPKAVASRFETFEGGTDKNNTQPCDNNATGFYRRNFTIDDSWKDKRIFLHFDGVYSAAVVWVDGKYVGYTQGSNNDAEFDITEALDKASDGNSILSGEAEGNVHQLSVRVYRWCDGSYLEGQDMWHLSGIHRDVYLVAKPKVFVSDAVITTSDLAEDATSGTLNVALTVDNRDLEAHVNKQFTVTVTDKEGNTVATAQSVNYESGNNPSESQNLNVSFTGLSGLHPWTAETPYLYNISVSQKNVNGTTSNEEMAFNTKYGFRKIAYDSKLVTINGKRVFFKGVNTQDTHPEYGRAIDVETMMKDLTMMKRANINTVRTSHYPRQAKMYAMMDALGFYVMDEADVECHGSWINSSTHITDQVSWSPQYVDRNERMVKRDRNHPCVIFWSLGNESGDGVCFENAYKAVKAIDSERPIHYEGTFNEGYSNGKGTNTNKHSDLFSTMYPPLWRVQNISTQWEKTSLPYFICEFAHAMGQALGNFKEYWDAVESSSSIIGGCIWDWVDQAIYKVKSGEGIVTDKTDDNGFHLWTSGADYNQSWGSDNTFQGNFMDNGLVTPDRRWSAKLTEVKKVYQYADFSAFDPSTKTVTVKNKYEFTTLSSDQFDITYQVLKDGRLVEEGKAESFETIAPRNGKGTDATAGSVKLPIKTNVGNNDKSEYLVNVELRLKNATDWAEAGYDVANAQFSLTGENGDISQPTLADKAVETTDKDGTTTHSSKTNTTALKITDNTVSGTDADGKAFSLSFGDDGKMTAWTYAGKSLLYTGTDATNTTIASGAVPDFNSMRNTENDIVTSCLQVNSSTTNIVSGKGLTLSDDGKATMSVNGTATNCNYTIDYTIYPDATVDMKVTFSPTGETRRLGLGMQFASGFENVEFYARGPWSNYSDRKTGSYLGRYTTTVDDMIEEFVHPQTYGDHQDLRELILTNAAKSMRLDIQVGGQASFSLSHYDETKWCIARGATTGQQQIYYDGLHWGEKLCEGSIYSGSYLTKQKQVYAHFDYYQMGLGNGSCNNVATLDTYKCPTTGNHTYTLRFKPSTFEKTNF